MNQKTNASPPALRPGRQSPAGLPALALLLALFGCLATPRVEARNDSRPNIIYILADDLGWGDLGCYGQQVIPTPNIDRLAADGIRFTQHYSGSTVCAPSRSALLEGMHTGHTSVRGNSKGQLLRPERITLAENLQAAGYATGISGKWGVGEPPPLDDPLRHGFDHAYGYVNMFHAHNFFPEFLVRNGRKVVLPGNVTDHSLGFDHMPDGTGVAKVKVTYAPDEIEQDALDFITENRRRPFFLYLALNLPHNNGEKAKVTGDGTEVPDYGEFADRDWPPVERGFARMVQLVDRAVGSVMERLRELGLDDNTLVVFCSDNGAYDGGGHDVEFFDSNGPWRGYKRDLYEGGIRAPFIARWPGHIASGTTSDHMSAMWDMLPTFAEVAGAEIPDGIDGISFLPALRGQPQTARHEFLYWEFYEQGGKQAVRKGDWKAVVTHLNDGKPRVFELFNLASDPGEQVDLAARHPEVAEELKAIMRDAHVPVTGLNLFGR